MTEKAVFVGIIRPGDDERRVKEYLDELEFLAETAGATGDKKFVQRVDRPDNATYIRSGKLEEIAAYCEENAITYVIFDDELTGMQQRNIEKVYEIADAILDICREPAGFESILQKLFTRYQLTMTFEQHALVGSTVRSYLTWLKEQGDLLGVIKSTVSQMEYEDTAAIEDYLEQCLAQNPSALMYYVCYDYDGGVYPADHSVLDLDPTTRGGWIEAQAAAGLMHSNIVNVYDVGEENGIYYIVMELVEGITLKKYIEEKYLDLEQFYR